MADLAELIGAVLAGVAQARRIADEESAAIAEHYKGNPLLEGMSVPRLRLPEVTLDIPVVVESQEEAKPGKFRAKTAFVRDVRSQLSSFARRQRLRLPEGFLTRFQAELERGYDESAVAERPTSEAFGRIADLAVDRAASGQEEPLDPSVLRAARSFARAQGARSAVLKPAAAPVIGVGALTSDVKNRSDAGNVTRVRITIKEEGLEWSEGEREDGTVFQKLTPE